MSPVYREVIRWARNVHLYLTLIALALVLFFSITGFMLNHEDWFVPATSFERQSLSLEKSYPCRTENMVFMAICLW